MSPMSEELKALYYNALIVLLSFEKYWGINLKSKGQVFLKESKEEAIKAYECIMRIFDQDKAIIDTTVLELTPYVSDEDLHKTLESLNQWGHNDATFIESEKKYFSRDARITHQLLLMSIERYLCSRLSLSYTPSFALSSAEDEFEQQISEWYGQVHPNLLNLITPSFIEEMNSSQSVVIVGDIRRSQDLMTYSREYTEKISTFIANVQQIVINNNGIFDRFTGDGFIAYFNEELCKHMSSDYYDQMWKCCIDIMHFATPFIDDWTKRLRKIPNEPIGLSIGIDAGDVFYSSFNKQVLAIGEPSVWATRMCSSGHKSEVIFNNIAYNDMLARVPDMNFIEMNSETKTGEQFTCHKVVIE